MVNLTMALFGAYHVNKTLKLHVSLVNALKFFNTRLFCADGWKIDRASFLLNASSRARADWNWESPLHFMEGISWLD